MKSPASFHRRSTSKFAPEIHIVEDFDEARSIFFDLTRKTSILPHGCISLCVEAATRRYRGEAFDPSMEEEVIRGIGLAVDGNMGFFISSDLLMADWKGNSIRSANMLEVFLPEILEKLPIVAHDVKYHAGWLCKMTSREAMVADCTNLASHLILGNRFKHDLQNLAQQFLNADPWPKTIKKKNGDYDKNEIARITAMDAVATIALLPILREGMEVWNVFPAYNRMIKATQVFCQIERRGSTIDLEKHENLSETYKISEEEALRQLKATAVYKCFIEKFGNKTPTDNDIIACLHYTGICRKNHEEGAASADFVGLNLPVKAWTKTGRPSIEEETLLSYYKDFDRKDVREFISTLKKWKKISKSGGFLKSMGPYIRTGTNKLSSRYLLEGTVAGRVSQREYSIHTLPPNSDAQRCFVSEWKNEGGLILCGDGNQMELRVLASLSNDEALKEAYRKGLDIHTFTAHELTGIPLKSIEKKSAERDSAKTVLLGSIYGSSIHSVARRTQKSYKEAARWYNNFFNKFPSVERFIKDCHDEAKANGFVRYATGRIRHINIPASGSGQRQAQNSPIQGAASDMVIDILTDFHDSMLQKSMESKVWGWVHDEIIADIYPGEFMEAFTCFLQSVKNVPEEKHPWFTVPSVWDFHIGTSWGAVCSVKSLKNTNNTWTLRIEGKQPHVEDVVASFRKWQKDIEIEVVREWTSSEKPDDVLSKKPFLGDTGGAILQETTINFIYNLDTMQQAI